MKTKTILVGMCVAAMATSCKQYNYVEPYVPPKKDTNVVISQRVQKMEVFDNGSLIYRERNVYGNDAILDTTYVESIIDGVVDATSFNAYTWNSDGQLIRREDTYDGKGKTFVDQWTYDNKKRLKRHVFIDAPSQNQVVKDYYYNKQDQIDYIKHSSGDSTDYVHSLNRIDIKTYSKEWIDLKEQERNGTVVTVWPKISENSYSKQGNVFYQNMDGYLITTTLSDKRFIGFSDVYTEFLELPAWTHVLFQYIPEKIINDEGEGQVTSESDRFGRVIKLTYTLPSRVETVKYYY